MNRYYYQIRRGGVDEDIRDTVEIHAGDDVTEEDIALAVLQAENTLHPKENEVLTYNGYASAVFNHACKSLESEMNCWWQYVEVIGTLII